MVEKQKIHIIKPLSTIKYRKFCKMIYNKYHKSFMIIDNRTVNINIPELMNILINNLKENRDTSFARNVKYTQMDFIKGIIDVINNCTYWSRYKGKVPGKYLNTKHIEYCKLGVYEYMYFIILMIYYKKSKYQKLKDQSMDSTFIRNLYGTEMIQRNPHNKSKNGIKISTINDNTGVAHSIAIGRGATNDAKIVQEQINFSFIDTNTKNVQNNNRYRQNIYGDSQYDSKDLHDILRKKGYKPITDVNKRNTNDETKLKQLEKRKRQYLKKCHKRSITETSFGWLHKYPKLDRFVEKTVKSYSGLLMLGLAITVGKKIK
jgi:Transposase DDE domain